MSVKRMLGAMLVTGLALANLTGPARAANTAPAITQFDKAFAAINDYSYKLHSHEVKGSAIQERVYDYWFLKPHYAKTYIESGDGKGGGGVWTGGTQVSGHQGGILSAFHLKVDLHDPRAVSLRGYTLPDGLMQNIVQTYVTTPGTLTQANGGKIGGVATDRLDLKVADPSAYGGISEMILYLSKTTHWPIRQILYQGKQDVLDQQFSDIKTDTGLKPSDFPF